MAKGCATQQTDILGVWKCYHILSTYENDFQNSQQIKFNDNHWNCKKKLFKNMKWAAETWK